VITNWLQVLTKLKREWAFPNITKGNKDVTNFLSNFINTCFIHKNKKPIRSNFIKIHFENKGIEDVNITKLLHTVTDAIPKSFQNREPPTVVYARSSCIGSKMFNYKNVVEHLDTNYWNEDDFTYDCFESKFCDQNHGHIKTSITTC
jgi:hypothetical protein